MGAGTNASPSGKKNADGVPPRDVASTALSCVVIERDDSGGPAELSAGCVDYVVELVVLLRIRGHRRAHRHDPQSGVAGLTQRLTDEDRGQAAALERVVDLGVWKRPFSV